MNGASHMIPFVVVGGVAFGLMYPILAGFIAFAIAGRAALAPAMICAQIAVSPDILGTEAGTGFLGCIVVGYAAGYLTKWFNTWKVPKAIKPIMPIFVIPLLGTGIIATAFILILGQPIAWLMGALNSMLAALSQSPATAIPLGLLLGAMGMIFGITDSVPHGGPIVGILGATNNILLFFLCIAV